MAFLAPLAGAIIGGGSAALAAGTGAGKTHYDPKAFGESNQYNASKLGYGTDPNAQNQVNHMDSVAGGFLGKTDGLTGESFQDRQAAQGQMAQENAIAGQLQQRANGQDLISDRVANQARQGVIGAANSTAASARGPAALALANKQAQTAQSAGLTNIAASEGVNAATEQLNNTNAALNARAGIAGQDLGSRATGLGSAANLGQVGAGLVGQENNVNATALQGGIADQQIRSGSFNQQQQLTNQNDTGNAATDLGYIKMATGGLSGGAQGGATIANAMPTSDPLAKMGINIFGATAGGENSDPKSKENVRQLGEDYRFRTAQASLDGALAGIDAQKATIAQEEHNTMKSFHRDSPADQAQIKNAELARMMAEADKMIAGYKQNLAAGPSVHVPQASPQGYAMAPTSDPHAKAQVREIGQAEGRALAHAEQSDFASQYMKQLLPSAVMNPLSSAALLGLGTKSVGHDIAAQRANAEAQDLQAIANRRAPRTLADSGVKQLDILHGPTLGRGSVPMTAEMQASAPIDMTQGQATVPPSFVAGYGQAPPSPVNKDIGGPSPVYDSPTSDPRAKKLGGVHNNEVSDYLDSTPAVSYQYKSDYFEPNSTKPGSTQVGFLTSDLKKTPVGKTVVEDRSDGYEGYNTHRMIGLGHAVDNNLHERLRDLEATMTEIRKGRK